MVRPTLVVGGDVGLAAGLVTVKLDTDRPELMHCPDEARKALRRSEIVEILVNLAADKGAEIDLGMRMKHGPQELEIHAVDSDAEQREDLGNQLPISGTATRHQTTGCCRKQMPEPRP